MRVYEEHRMMAKEYLLVQKELQWMTKYCNELVEHFEQNGRPEEAAGGSTTGNGTGSEPSELQKSVEEYVQLQNEKESLIQLYHSLKEQLNRFRLQQQQKQQQQQQQQQQQLQQLQQQQQPPQQQQHPEPSSSPPLPDDGWVVLSRT